MSKVQWAARFAVPRFAGSERPESLNMVGIGWWDFPCKIKNVDDAVVPSRALCGANKW